MSVGEERFRQRVSKYVCSEPLRKMMYGTSEGLLMHNFDVGGYLLSVTPPTIL